MMLAMKYDGKGVSCRKDGTLFVLSTRVKEHVPTDGKEAEFMIVDVLGKHTQGFIVMPTTNCVLVEHTGFECAGTMCSTTASVKDLASPGWLTPGRVGDLVHVAQNVNVGWGQERRPKNPGRVFVAIGENRAAGLPDVCDVDHARWKALIAWRHSLSDMKRQAD